MDGLSDMELVGLVLSMLRLYADSLAILHMVEADIGTSRSLSSFIISRCVEDIHKTGTIRNSMGQLHTRDWRGSVIMACHYVIWYHTHVKRSTVANCFIQMRRGLCEHSCDTVVLGTMPYHLPALSAADVFHHLLSF